MATSRSQWQCRISSSMERAQKVPSGKRACDAAHIVLACIHVFDRRLRRATDDEKEGLTDEVACRIFVLGVDLDMPNRYSPIHFNAR
ncbi:hypothetical protein BV22DRAFT_493471 [Leucogyrophana mollusca]|uniref:Uncharacterized protein n=1 Tax=Leucogyrophana mollusca TaxID=85980 RepID=A0ACB8BFM1_9AGAM|nr:hypothetical protein BV22DRAFT_493471 [Leucogyrophana mollusca]